MGELKSATVCAMLAVALVIGDESANAAIQAPGGGQIRALIVGLDDYPHLPASKRLHGAINDARDLSQTLARAGVPKSNITYLSDKSEASSSSGLATRDAVIAGIKRLIADSKAGDLVVISFAGHGLRLPEKVKTKPDGMDEAYVLYNYDPAVAATSLDVVIGPEMKKWLGELEGKGVDVLYVVDTCHGGGMTRGWDLHHQESGEDPY